MSALTRCMIDRTPLIPAAGRRFALLLPLAAALSLPGTAFAHGADADAPAAAAAGDPAPPPPLLSAGQSGSGADETVDRTAGGYDPDMLTVGAGVAVVPSYEGSNHYRVSAIGAFRARVAGFNISTRGTQIGADLLREPAGARWNWQLGPVLNLNLNRTGNLVDPQVRALGKRRAAFEAGGYAGISRVGVLTSQYDTLTVRVAVLGDVSGVNKSYKIMPAIEYGTPLSKHFYVGASVSASIVGDSYARTYFAVDQAGSARSGLPVFADPKGGLKSWTVAAIFSRSITGDLRHGLGVYGAVSYTRLEGDFARSPIVSQVGDANQLLGAIGIGYTF